MDVIYSYVLRVETQYFLSTSNIINSIFLSYSTPSHTTLNADNSIPRKRLSGKVHRCDYDVEHILNISHRFISRASTKILCRSWWKKGEGKKLGKRFLVAAPSRVLFLSFLFSYLCESTAKKIRSKKDCLERKEGKRKSRKVWIHDMFM